MTRSQRCKVEGLKPSIGKFESLGLIEAETKKTWPES